MPVRSASQISALKSPGQGSEPQNGRLRMEHGFTVMHHVSGKNNSNGTCSSPHVSGLRLMVALKRMHDTTQRFCMPVPEGFRRGGQPPESKGPRNT